ncbi:MAG: hypothetical protein ACOYMA_17515 [Bacteroidia bacterium]
MLSKIWEFILNNTLILILISGLVIFGNVINALIPWQWFKFLFIILQKTSLIFDFMVDIPTLWLIFGITLVIEAAYWGLKGILFIVAWYRNNVVR